MITPSRANLNECILLSTDTSQYVVYNNTILPLKKVSPSPTLCLSKSDKENERVNRQLYFDMQVDHLKVKDESISILG